MTTNYSDQLDALTFEAEGSWCDSCRDIGTEAMACAHGLRRQLEESHKQRIADKTVMLREVKKANAENERLRDGISREVRQLDSLNPLLTPAYRRALERLRTLLHTIAMEKAATK